MREFSWADSRIHWGDVRKELAAGAPVLLHGQRPPAVTAVVQPYEQFLDLDARLEIAEALAAASLWVDRRDEQGQQDLKLISRAMQLIKRRL